MFTNVQIVLMPRVGKSGTGIAIQSDHEVSELAQGDIGSVAKLKDTHTNDTFCSRSEPVQLPPVPFAEPVATSAVKVKTRGDEDKPVVRACSAGALNSRGRRRVSFSLALAALGRELGGPCRASSSSSAS